MNHDAPADADDGNTIATKKVTHFASVAGPLALWLVVQLAALALGAFGVPLSDEFPQPPEQLAVHEMLVAQIALSAALFPLLLRSLRSTITVLITLWPMLTLAAVLSSAPTIRILMLGVYVSAWIITLALWRILLRCRSRQLTAAAVALILTLGGAFLWYLGVEFGGRGPDIDWRTAGFMGPLMGAYSVLATRPPSLRPWAMLAALGFLPTAILLVTWLSRQVIHNSSTKRVPNSRG